MSLGVVPSCHTVRNKLGNALPQTMGVKEVSNTLIRSCLCFLGGHSIEIPAGMTQGVQERFLCKYQTQRCLSYSPPCGPSPDSCASQTLRGYPVPFIVPQWAAIRPGQTHVACSHRDPCGRCWVWHGAGSGGGSTSWQRHPVGGGISISRAILAAGAGGPRTCTSWDQILAGPTDTQVPKVRN